MRQTISGLVAALAVLAAAPAMACGYGSCSPCSTGYVSPCVQPQVYVSPVADYGYSGCNTGCGWAHESLPDPVRQYYYVNQGPTYTGPGSWAPLPTYQESAVSGWDAYRRPYYYGYDGGRYAGATNHYYDGVGVEGPAIYGYRAHRHFRLWRAHPGVRYMERPSVRYGYAPRRSMRYGTGGGMMLRHYGRHERMMNEPMMRRYN
jgi:hypothetical protein